MNSGGVDNKTDSLLSLYCTDKLITFINNLYSEPPGKIDSDILLQSQMVDVRMLEKLTIRKDSLKNDVYHVFIKYGTGGWSIKLSVKKEKGAYKIDHVFIPGIDK
jgi:hypothetical protein